MVIIIVVVVVATDEAFGTLSSFRGPRAGAGGVVDQEEDDQTEGGNEAVAQYRHYRLRILHDDDDARDRNGVTRDASL